MARRAYLVAHFDITSGKPVLTGTGIYSESAQSLTGAIGRGQWSADVIDVAGYNFAEARKKLIAGIREMYPETFGWALDALPPGELERDYG